MRAPLTLPAGNTMLLLIDLQEEHRKDRRFLVDGYDEILANGARLLDAARQHDIPVVHAAYERDFSAEPRRSLEPVSTDGTPYFSRPDSVWTGICAEVAPVSGERVVKKNDASCFSSREFAAALTGVNPDWIIAAGVWTEACLASTVKDAIASGHRVLVVKDACGSGTQAMHQSAMIHIANRLYGGAVAATENAVHLMAGKPVEAWQLVGSTTLRFTSENLAEVYHSL